MEKRPRIPVKLTAFDYLIEIIGIIGVISLFVLTIYFFNDLPPQIPKHFNALGQVDAYGNRGTIWLLPIVGLVLYTGLTVLNKFPFLYNYPAKVTTENAEKLYTLGTRTIRLLKLIVILLFVFLNFKTIEIALNRSTEIGKFFLPVFLAITVFFVGTTIFKMTKK